MSKDNYRPIALASVVGKVAEIVIYTVETVLGDHPFCPAKTVSQDRWSLIAGRKKIGSVPMFPGTYVPRYLCSPVPMFPGTYVPRYLCSSVPMFPEPMFPGTYVPRYLCSPNLCSPVPMFPGTYVPRFAVNDSSTPPRLIFLSLQIDMIIVILALVVTVSVR